MAHYFEDLAELGRWSASTRITADPGVDIMSFAAGLGEGSAYFEQQPSLRRVTGFIAHHLSSVNLNLYKWEDGGDRLREYPNQHAAARFLEDPAGPDAFGITAMDLKGGLILDGLIHDKFVAQIVYDERTNLPVGLHRLPASRVRFKGAAGRVTGASYQREDGTRVTLDLGSLFFRIGYTPHTGANGAPQIKTLRALLDGNTDALEYRAKMLREAARVPGVLTHPKVMEQVAYERLRSSWSEFKLGGARAGSEPILEDGVKYEQIKPLTGDDVLDLDGRKLTDTEVATMYWIYPELLGMREGTNSNMQALKEALWTICLAPYLTSWQQSWDRMIRQQFRIQNRYVDADVESKIAGSFKEETDATSRAVGGPWLSRAEARSKRNLPYIEGTDELILPMNVTDGGKASPMDGE